mmetsp:Transcript_50871/g.45658  ORF Transcript_50871/g.45658 Transcript_50871/m.45658 type:complete len:196 (-) Transcript_50871:799-1386(-)
MAMSAVTALLNGDLNSSTTANSDTVEELQKQIDILKKVIHDKNIQLNMVIKHAEEKYHDIHANYRDLASQLHDSWKTKYDKLEKENNRLMGSLTNLVKQNKPNKLLEIEQETNNDSENDITSPISHIPIENIAESLDLDDNQLNQLTGGNIQENIDINNNKTNNSDSNDNYNQQSTSTSKSKTKPKKRVVEAYID